MLHIPSLHKPLQKDRALSEYITYGHLVFFLATLPFDRFYSQLALISLSAHVVINFRKSRIDSRLVKPAIFSSLLYLMALLGTIYSSYKVEAYNDWEKQMALILFPLLFLFSAFDFAKYKWKLLTAFAATCTITVLYLYVQVIRVILYNHLPIRAIFSSVFLNHNFSAPIGLHATYMSMYVLLSMVIVIILALKQTKRGWLYIPAIIILALGLLQLSSRAVFISAVFVLNVSLPILLMKGKQRWVATASFAALGLITVLAIVKIDAFKNRYVVELKEDLTQIADRNELLEPRIVRWQVAMDLIKNSIVFGHGSGSEIAILKEKYFEDKLYNSYLNQLNAHNQYLSFLLKFGIIGLGVYLFILYYGFKIAFRSNDVVFLSFLLIIFVVSFSENILDVNKGIFFFAFFYSYFVFSNQGNDKEQALIRL